MPLPVPKIGSLVRCCVFVFSEWVSHLPIWAGIEFHTVSMFNFTIRFPSSYADHGFRLCSFGSHQPRVSLYPSSFDAVLEAVTVFSGLHPTGVCQVQGSEWPALGLVAQRAYETTTLGLSTSQHITAPFPEKEGMCGPLGPNSAQAHARGDLGAMEGTAFNSLGKLVYQTSEDQ